MSLLQEKIADGQREEESWKAELAEITGTSDYPHNLPCYYFKTFHLQSSPVMPKGSTKCTLRREESFFRGKVYVLPKVLPFSLVVKIPLYRRKVSLKCLP